MGRPPRLRAKAPLGVSCHHAVSWISDTFPQAQYRALPRWSRSTQGPRSCVPVRRSGGSGGQGTMVSWRGDDGRQGRVLGVLGPNGAGKTTAVRILGTLLKPDGGQASVCGYDVLRDAHQVRQLIGLTGQYASVDEGLAGAN